ncbi:MAG: hypothetical protein ACXVEE_10490 [Polyangiales bacterium]
MSTLPNAALISASLGLGFACATTAPAPPVCPPAPSASVPIVVAPSAAASASGSASARVWASLPMRRVHEESNTHAAHSDLEPTPFIDVEEVDKHAFLLGVTGIEVWNGKAFVRHQELEKGLHVDKESGQLTHDSLAFAGKFPSHLFVVTGRPKLGGRRLYERTGDAFKELARCELGSFNEMHIAEWGDGVVSVCSMMGSGPTKVFGKTAWKAPKVPHYKQKLTGDHKCYEADSLFEPVTVVRVEGGLPLFQVQDCRGMGWTWARWVPEAEAWQPADPPDSSFGFAGDWAIREEAHVLVGTKKNAGDRDVAGEIKLPDPGTTLVRWHVIGDDLWVVAKWWDAEKTLHAGLYTSAP